MGDYSVSCPWTVRECVCVASCSRSLSCSMRTPQDYTSQRHSDNSSKNEAIIMILNIFLCRKGDVSNYF